MSKGSGGTRGSSWRDKQSGFQKEIADAEYLTAQIKSGAFVESDDRRSYDIWEDMTEKERLVALERAEFTGMVQDESLEATSIFAPTSKKDIVGTLQDELYNVKEGFDMEDSNHYVIKIKNRRAIYSEDLSKPLTQSEVRDLEWVSGNGGLAMNRYYAKDDKAKQSMIKTMNFNEFHRGKEINSYNGQYITDRHFSYEEQNWHD